MGKKEEEGKQTLRKENLRYFLPREMKALAFPGEEKMEKDLRTSVLDLSWEGKVRILCLCEGGEKER